MQRASWGEGSPLHQQHVCSRCCYTRNIFFPASKTRGKRRGTASFRESTSPSQRIAHPHLQLQVSSDTGSLVPSCNTWGNLLSKTHPDPWSQKTWCWMPSCFLLHLLGWYLLEKANPGAQPLDIAHAVYLPPLGIPRHYEGKRWRHYMNTYLLKQGPRASLKYQTKSFPIHLQNQ